MNEEKQQTNNIKPLGARVLVQVESEPEQTASGIIIPETASQEKPQQGKIVAIGEGKTGDDGKRISMSVKEGDTIIFSKFGPDKIKVGDEEYLIVEEGDILAIIS